MKNFGQSSRFVLIRLHIRALRLLTIKIHCRTLPYPETNTGSIIISDIAEIRACEKAKINFDLLKRPKKEVKQVGLGRSADSPFINYYRKRVEEKQFSFY